MDVYLTYVINLSYFLSGGSTLISGGATTTDGISLPGLPYFSKLCYFCDGSVDSAAITMALVFGFSSLIAGGVFLYGLVRRKPST